MDEWIQKQLNKYCFNDFHSKESDIVVNKNVIAYQKLKDYAKPGMSFLDLGTNCGRVAYEMKKLGLIEFGIDLPEVINKITYPINKQGMNLEKEFPLGTFDLIFFRECLEHLRNGEEVCKKVIDALSPKGIAIITAPYDERDFKENCPEHFRLYKGQELKQLIEKVGGVVVDEFNEIICRSHICIAKRRM